MDDSKKERTDFILTILESTLDDSLNVISDSLTNELNLEIESMGEDHDTILNYVKDITNNPFKIFTQTCTKLEKEYDEFLKSPEALDRAKEFLKLIQGLSPDVDLLFDESLSDKTTQDTVKVSKKLQ